MSSITHSNTFQKLNIDIRNLILINSIDSKDEDFDFDFDYDPNEMYYALLADK